MYRNKPRRALSPGLPRLLKPLELFFRVEASGGVALLFATAIALLLANSPWSEAFSHFWEAEPLPLPGLSPHFIINEGLMSLFFLVVGLEIRREMHEGALSTPRTAALPVAAALGGIITPAVLYLLFNDGGAARGWAIPTATDIAFAIGVLALLGNRIDPALRILLLALAIADDIAAILIIAVFYAADGISAPGMALAVAGIIGVLVFQRQRVRAAPAYILPGLLLWIGLLAAGLHPALCGVILGLLTPMGQTEDREFPPAVRLAVALHPWVAFGVMPLFALANAGVSLDGLAFDNAESLTVMTGIMLGLVVGKPLGIMATTLLAVRTGLCRLPPGVNWKGLAVVGCLGGIGFTMSVFIAALAFDAHDLLAAAKFAVLVASALSGLVGLFLGSVLLARPPQPEANEGHRHKP